MKYYIIIFLFYFIPFNSFSQKTNYFDSNKNLITKESFLKKVRSKEQPKSSWKYKSDNAINYILNSNRYSNRIINYSGIKTHLTKTTSRPTNDSTIILIEYRYKNDLCSKSSKDNKWDKIEIGQRKYFLKPFKKEFDKKNILFLVLFEEGIKLKNRQNARKEYFYKDKNNFFRKLIFKNPSTCGSYAVMKPNGQILIRNGEYRVDMMIEHLKDENWSMFFQVKKQLNSLHLKHPAKHYQ